MAKPNKKGPVSSITIYCAHCKSKLFKYKKGGKGALIKCFKERIVKDFTQVDCQCPQCKQTFARDCLIRGAPAFKIIGGKVMFR